ncbi:SDR family NAD(P)-dependent oxidoreductase [Pelagibius litoralis]|uniref:SDR family NAD(P)-dependent oxidoreductase n=1 Tax=Pelagibius litoralis TaxID=374515 RepID=A0A967F0I8_9PROT|nr:SDR family NAD(P)-dependent oxidoreductase [Pelagibius litoralis]NIA70772.1 SDR family NAD(P)-dependent oxidoreductase [Pelagibius litoralis]
MNKIEGKAEGPEQPLCLVVGVGDATGAALVRRFADGGYRVAMIARNAQRLEALARKTVSARAYPCDVADYPALTETLAKIRRDLGEPAVLVYNAVSATFRRFEETTVDELEANFRVNTAALLVLVQQLAPAMRRAGRGAILVTGNTAALRGVPNYAVFAPTKAAQRILAQSLARDLGPDGIHVAYITVDAAIDVTWYGPEDQKPAWLKPPDDWPHRREDFFAKPEAIAEEVFHIGRQDRSTWSFDHVIRPFAEHW